MRRTLVTVTVASAVLAAPAAGHITPRPAGLESGAAERVELETPNERDDRATTRVTVTVPDGLEIVLAEAPEGWTVAYSATEAVWKDGRIEGIAAVRFPVLLEAAGPARDVKLDVRQRYDDGAEVTFSPGLSVLPAGAGAPRQHLGRALIASVVGIAVVAGSLVVLQRARRRDRDRVA